MASTCWATPTWVQPMRALLKRMAFKPNIYRLQLGLSWEAEEPDFGEAVRQVKKRENRDCLWAMFVSSLKFPSTWFVEVPPSTIEVGFVVHSVSFFVYSAFPLISISKKLVKTLCSRLLLKWKKGSLWFFMLDTYDVTSLIFHLGDYCFDCIVIVVVVEQIGLVQVNMRSSARAASVPPHILPYFPLQSSIP